LMFPDGERKPGRTAPERPATDDDAATAAMTVATALEMRSELFMDVSLIIDRAILRPLSNGQVTVA